MLESYNATAQLTKLERLRLTQLESIVEQGLQTFYEVGKALEEIRDQKLSRETERTFEAYCRNKWNIAKRTAYQLIDAAQVMENLAEIEGSKPTNERQVRPLAKLDPELQIKIWEEALELATNGKPTGASVKRLVDKHLSSDEEQTKPSSKNGYSEIDRLRLENQHLKERLKQNDAEREKRAAEIAAQFEELRRENQQLREENRKLRSQLADMTAKYEAVLARLEAIEKGK
jgi:regulator of replication initiation timing